MTPCSRAARPPGDSLARGVLEAARASGDVLVGVCAGDPPVELLDHLALTSVLSGTDRRTVVVPNLDAASAMLRDVTESHPDAACSLVHLLQLSHGLGVRDALRAESFAYSALQGGREHQRWLAAHTRRAAVTVVDPLRVSRDGDVLSLRLSRVERRNAVDRHLRDALLDALDIARLDPAVRVELSADGPCFSSGGDLDEFGTATDPALAHLVRTSRSVGLALHRLHERVAARVHGACAGAGVELPLFADHVTAAPGTTLRLPEPSMGLVPGAGGTVSLTRRAGRWRTAWMVLSGQALDAETALTCGLVDAIE